MGSWRENFISLRGKMSLLLVVVSLLPLVGLSFYISEKIYWLEAKTAVGGLMNFVDTKQQGVIRFIGQNEKLAQQLAVLVEATDPKVAQTYFATIVKTDIFQPEDHQFHSEIESGERHIATWRVYHNIDFVRNGKIQFSSDPNRVGKSWSRAIDLHHGYSDVYGIGDKMILTFGAPAKGGMVYINVDAHVLTLIVNGEIGNLEGNMGAYYLAGVGKTFDYYMVNRKNVMITQSRVFPHAMLVRKGSEEPWKRTLDGAKNPNCIDGVYTTNAGATTGCREAMGFYRGATGKLMLGASMPFYDSEWTIVVEQEASELFGPLFGVRNQMWLIVSIIVLAAVLLTTLFMRRAVTIPLRKVVGAAEGIAAGHIDQKIDHRSSDEIGRLADSFRRLIDYIQGVAGAADALNEGNLSVEVAPKSDQDLLSKNFIRVKETLKGLVGETKTLIEEANEGRLSKRGEACKFRGVYGEVLTGINQMLDAVGRPVSEAADVLGRVAERDLTARMQGEYKGDFAKIKEALNTAVENLDESLTRVSLSADQVAFAAAQVDTGSQALAEGSSEQAGSLQEISSSLQETASMSRQNALGAKEAKHMTDGAGSSVELGVENMNRLSEAVNRIKLSADATAKIVKTIDEIAFQTNLLALNAAVEAARAGDAGKGFAVVAEEVRNLAQRSAEAAKDTARLIEDSVTNADEGVSLNKEVLNNLDEIKAEVERLTEVMAEIEAASEQQNQGIDQINAAIEQLNQLTQQNAANTEESASAAEEMSGQAEEMRSLVASFELSGPASEAAPKLLNPQSEERKSRRPLAAVKPIEGRESPELTKGHGRIPLDDDDLEVLEGF